MRHHVKDIAELYKILCLVIEIVMKFFDVKVIYSVIQTLRIQK